MRSGDPLRPLVGQRPRPLHLHHLADVTAGVAGNPGVVGRVDGPGATPVADAESRLSHRFGACGGPRSTTPPREATARSTTPRGTARVASARSRLETDRGCRSPDEASRR